MSVTDAFVVGEDWIGEHYFGSDAKSQSFHARLVALRKAWDAAEADGEPTPRRSLISARGDLEAALARVPSPADTGERPAADVTALRETVTRPLLDALGFVEGPARSIERDGPVQWVTALGDEHPALAIVEARPVEAAEALLQKDERNLAAPFEAEGEKPIASVARLLSSIFLTDHAPAFALVTAGPWLLLAERERWAEGRYLAVDAQAVLSRNDVKKAGEVDRLVACVSAETLLPSPDGTTWWRETLDDSAKHTVSVSKDLREGVRRSIELIANEVVRRRRAKGLEPLPADQAQPLARQSLRYIYRILFLLYAEASPEMGVLPLATGDYEEGYSLDRLRDLLLVPIDPDDDGTHLHASLGVLFRLVDEGAEQRDDDELAVGLQFESLKADLFLPSAISRIAEVGLGDGALHQVLSMLLLSKEQRGKDRGFISYAELGINQLGAVYEGLMSYTGFFAETHLHEVAKGGDASKGSWVVPTDRSGDLSPDDFVKRPDANGAMVPVVHEPGSFVFRLAGRERQQSASYYTPEVLTRFTVSQALEELLDQDGTRTTAEEVLGLTVCEPALGSGAFAIEATRQLAEEYLKRRQNELDERIEPDDYARELQKVKAHIALHNVYGVDLNATAVELAEVSLWLDTMVSGLQAPWFGLHLRRGNSLIGARRAVYSLDAVRSKAWLTEAPRDVPMTSLRADLDAGRLGSGLSGGIHHFLLPAEGWGAGADAKEAKELAPDAVKRLQIWRRSFRTKPSKQQISRLQSLALRVETLWQFALRRIEIAEREIRRDVDVWGHESVEGHGVTRTEITRALFDDADSPYRRLRLVADAWCSMWFWPVEEQVSPPSFDEWLDGLELLLGHHAEAGAKARAAGQTSIVPSTDWTTLGDGESMDLAFAGAIGVNEAIATTKWLRVAASLAQEQGFFHWELDFASAFARGGFDLHVGNPPWVRPRSDVEALLAESDPWWQLRGKTPQTQIQRRKATALADTRVREFVSRAAGEVVVYAAFMGSPTMYPKLSGLQPDFYRCFMELVWRNASEVGIAALVHPESHFTEEKAGVLRENVFLRLRRHWGFSNELHLFEVHNRVRFGVNVYGHARKIVLFTNGVGLYHPETAERSLMHDGTGPEPGIRDDRGGWDLRPHRGRIVAVDESQLKAWHSILEGSQVPVLHTRMVYTVNRSLAKVLDKIARSTRIDAVSPAFSRGWDESIDRSKGKFDVRWGSVDSWNDVILQGPHLFLSNAFYKSPRASMMSNRDWERVDLEGLASEAKPVTVYKPAGDRHEYDRSYPHWVDGRSPRSAFRVAWRNMAGEGNERTLIPSLIPPGAAHVHAVLSAGFPEGRHVLLALGFMSSLLADSVLRAAAPSTIHASIVKRLPIALDHPLEHELLLRASRLSMLTNAFAPLWSEVSSPHWSNSDWTGGIDYEGRPSLSADGDWNSATPLRRDRDRQQALLEVDALVALMTGVSIEELCAVYRNQFPVLYERDRTSTYYDSNGRMVPHAVLQRWRKSNGLDSEQRRATHPGSGLSYTYALPFVTLDREGEMREAYSHFERLLEEAS